MSAAQSHLDNIFTNVPIGIVTTDLAYGLDLVNAVAAQMHRVADTAAVRGCSLLEFVDDPDVVRAQLDRVVRQEVPRVEVPYTVSAAEEEYETVYVEATVTLLRDDRYVPIGVLLMCADVTEKRRLEERLREAEQLALVGRLAVTLQHEINNPLQSLMGSAEMLLRRAGLPEVHCARLRTILEEARRIAERIESLRTLTEVKTVPYSAGIEMIDLDACERKRKTA